VFSAVGDEGRAKFNACQRNNYRGIYGGLTFWTPNINLFRDPRWGRGQETYGEDPCLTARMGCAVVRGLQGSDPVWLKTAACAKHFIVHSGPEKVRHSFDAKVSPRDFAATYAPAFEALVRESQVEAVMGAYSRTNGEPCCASPTLQRLLRGTWGFEGHFVSDCGALDNLHKHHGCAADEIGSAALAVKQGCDLNCGSTYKAILLAVERGQLSEAEVDTCVVRLITARLRLGSFGKAAKRHPQAKMPIAKIDCPEHRQLALEAARASLVLLRNNGALPLARSIPAMLVTGPAAQDNDVLLGNYNGVNPRITSLMEGILAEADPGSMVNYARGCGWTGPADAETGGIAMHFLWDQKPGVVVACVGLSAALEGEDGDAADSEACGDRVNVGLPPVQLAWLKKLRGMLGAGKQLVVVLTGGSPVSCPWLAENADAVLQVFYPGQAGGTAVAEVLFGAVNPAGRLPFTVPTGLEQLPPFEDYAMAGRTYRYSEQKPLWPFGFGLSYTTFRYAKAKAAKPVIAADGSQQVEVTVTNTGKRAGDEVVQCYLRDDQASVPVPRHQLVGFQRIHLKPGQSRRVAFTIAPAQLACHADDGTPMVEPGSFTAFLGGGQPGVEAWGGSPVASVGFKVG
jgi:beta-glucosidase